MRQVFDGYAPSIEVPQAFDVEKKCIRIAGRPVSVGLERIFWKQIEARAVALQIPVSKLLTLWADEYRSVESSVSLASFIRIKATDQVITEARNAI